MGSSLTLRVGEVGRSEATADLIGVEGGKGMTASAGSVGSSFEMMSLKGATATRRA